MVNKEQKIVKKAKGLVGGIKELLLFLVIAMVVINPITSLPIH